MSITQDLMSKTMLESWISIFNISLDYISYSEWMRRYTDCCELRWHANLGLAYSSFRLQHKYCKFHAIYRLRNDKRIFGYIEIFVDSQTTLPSKNSSQLYVRMFWPLIFMVYHILQSHSEISKTLLTNLLRYSCRANIIPRVAWYCYKGLRENQQILESLISSN